MQYSVIPAEVENVWKSDKLISHKIDLLKFRRRIGNSKILTKSGVITLKWKIKIVTMRKNKVFKKIREEK